jgi:16S rRNA (guanine966-N2)-methyltransferase
MRVISGTCKGRALKAVPGMDTRPTTDKVKESLFNMIGPYFSGGVGLDLFAGSGGLGIEALSRGMEKVIFVDRDFKANHTIKENLKLCHFENQSEVFRNEAERALKAIVKREMKFNGIFLDPPYKKQRIELILQTIEENELLQQDGFIVCEHDSKLSLPDRIGILHQTRHEQYGMIGISIFKRD